MQQLHSHTQEVFVADGAMPAGCQDRTPSWKHNTLTLNAEQLCAALRDEGIARAADKRLREERSGKPLPPRVPDSAERDDLGQRMHNFAVQHVQRKL